ncbi:MAG: XdhC/CoxI family protein [Planctomycetes bacterium]|nr:XdhC/CoxI family protein [Planctomycetota bacterium]
MHNDAIGFAHQSLAAGLPVALAILTESGRDTPGVPGALLAVRADRVQAGTVGGGRLEAAVIDDCLAALASDDPVRHFDHSLRPDGGLGMVCGGEVRGVITVLRPEKRLVVFGGGHVGQKVAAAGLVAGFAVTVVEERPEFAPADPGIRFQLAEDFALAARELDVSPDCYVVVATRGHAQDYAVIDHLVGRGCGYLGMIGSTGKVAGLRARLAEQGIPDEAVAAIHTPIGVDVDDGSPGEIAIGIIAEILAVKNRRPLRHRRERVQ